MSWVTRLGKAYDRLLGVLMALSCIMLAAAMLLVCLDVFMRYLFNTPILWAMDVCEFILVGIVSLGMAWLLKDEAHVRMDFLVERLSPRKKALLSAVNALIGAVTLAVILRYGVVEIAELWQRRYAVETGVLRIPKVSLLIPIALGLFLFFVQFVRQAVVYIQRFRSLGRGQ